MRDTIEAPKTPKAQDKVAAEDQKPASNKPAFTQTEKYCEQYIRSCNYL